MTDQPVDPRLDRYRPLSSALSWAMALASVLCVAAVVVPDPLGRSLGVALVAILVVAPLLRVVWFIARWARRGDRRFALVGCGVLAVIAVGFALALLGV